MAHKLNTELTIHLVERGSPDEFNSFSKRIAASQNIISLVETLYGYMQDDVDLVEKQQTQLRELNAEYNDDMKLQTNTIAGYKKRIKLLTSKLKSVSELQTKK